jgi:hypothetical protein
MFDLIASWITIICFYIFLATLIVYVIRKRKLIFQEILVHKKIYVFLLFIVLSGFLLRLVVAQPTMLSENHHSYGYLQAALHKSYETMGYYPNTSVLVYSMFRPLLQHSPSGFFLVNVLLGSLTIVTFYLVSFVITRKRYLGILAALFIALSPIHIKYSNSDIVEIGSLLFLSLMLYFSYFVLFSNNKNRVLDYILLIVVGYLTIMYRPDNVFLLPFLFVLSVFSPYLKRNTILSSILLLLQIPWIYYLLNHAMGFSSGVVHFDTLFSLLFGAKSWVYFSYFSLPLVLLLLFSVISVIPALFFSWRKTIPLIVLVITKLVIDFSFMGLSGAKYEYLRFHFILLLPLTLFLVLASGLFLTRNSIKKYVGLSTIIFVIVLVSNIAYIQSDQRNMHNQEFFYLQSTLPKIGAANVFVLSDGDIRRFKVYDAEPFVYFSYYFPIQISYQGEMESNISRYDYAYLGPGCYFPFAVEDTDYCERQLETLDLEYTLNKTIEITPIFDDQHIKKMNIGLITIR